MPEPTWLKLARTFVGLKELPGPANNSRIMDWAAKLGTKVLGIVYAGDHVPWCGLFVAHVMSECGYAPPKIAVRASAWATWGTPVPRAYKGAVLVFQRPGGGHVAIAVGEDPTHYHVLGGNQGDAVSITRIAKNRCIAMRWPAGAEMNSYVERVAAVGAVSKNEA